LKGWSKGETPKVRRLERVRHWPGKDVFRKYQKKSLSTIENDQGKAIFACSREEGRILETSARWIRRGSAKGTRPEKASSTREGLDPVWEGKGYGGKRSTEA